LADNLVGTPEEDGVDHRVEPPSWLPEGAVPAVTEEVTANGSAQADDAGEHDFLNGAESSGAGASAAGHGEDSSAGVDGPDAAGQDPFAVGMGSLAGGAGSGNASQEPLASDADSLTYGQAGSYVYEHGSPYQYQQENAYSAGFAADPGYNHGVMSEPTSGDSQVPPYPAEVAPQPATAATARSAFATAAYRALPKPRPKPKSRPRPGPRPGSQAATPARRANLVVARFEPWSVMKFSFLMSLVAWVVLFVAVAVLYYALSALGVFDAIQKTLSSVTSSQGTSGVDLSKWTSASRVLGYTMLIGAVNIVLITALSTIGAMIYNLVTHLGGGVEVTLRETD
jgi:transmembrane protein DUF3566